MSKRNGNGGDGFNNALAKLFRNPDKVDTLSQKKIFDTFNDDIGTLLGQMTAYRNHDGKFPQYIQNAFCNLSSALWFKEYVKDHCKITKKGKLKSDLSEDELESLRLILADAYKKSAQNQYPQQTQEFTDRNKMLSETFILLCNDQYKLARKLGLDKSQTRDLCIQIYGDPIGNMKFIHKIFNHSIMSDKKKIKLLKKLYGDRFDSAVGAAMTVDANNSDCIAMLYDYMMSLKKKKRAPIIMAYAIAYKRNKSNNFRMAGDGEFYRKNKDIIKELKDLDIGFKKAFKPLKKKSVKDLDKKLK